MYRFSIYGKEAGEDMFNALLEDYHVRGEHGERKYRKRGKDLIPVYDPPSTIGFIDPGRKGRPWSGCAWIPPDTASDIVTLLSYPIPLYFTVHEVKEGRQLQIRGITVQSTDPADE